MVRLALSHREINRSERVMMKTIEVGYCSFMNGHRRHSDAYAGQLYAHMRSKSKACLPAAAKIEESARYQRERTFASMMPVILFAD